VHKIKHFIVLKVTFSVIYDAVSTANVV